jgi:hypothetical protein
MQVIILDPSARRVEALVLSIGRRVIRVVPRRSADTLELQLSYGRWTDESGVPVEFESFVAAPGVDVRSMVKMPEAYAAAS